ncbi:unannotated protein [freshwater metagenome]|uniref:Unannotated protein n=1 Tax=freshwater metagenome TaxID=449393 RepID=A0A6J7C256_9ZZZZ
MPTPRPIIAASVGAKVATSRKRATKRRNVAPSATPKIAVRRGSPAAMSDPNATRRMINATVTPTPSLLGGSWPANASTWPLAPTVMPSLALAAFTASMIALAVVEGTALPSPLPLKVTTALATCPSGLTGENAWAAAARAVFTASCWAAGTVVRSG